MAELLPEIRNTTRALIFRQEQILLLKKRDNEQSERFALPGGGQNPGETLIEALNRECMEEIGTSVKIGNLIHVADLFKLRNRQPPTQRHLVEFLFICSVPSDYSPCNGHHPDKHQVDVVWIKLTELAQLPLFPRYLANCIARHNDVNRSPYLGTFDYHATH